MIRALIIVELCTALMLGAFVLKTYRHNLPTKVYWIAWAYGFIILMGALATALNLAEGNTPTPAQRPLAIGLLLPIGFITVLTYIVFRDSNPDHPLPPLHDTTPPPFPPPLPGTE